MGPNWTNLSGRKKPVTFLGVIQSTQGDSYTQKEAAAFIMPQPLF
jgi:hypothetical protein